MRELVVTGYFPIFGFHKTQLKLNVLHSFDDIIIDLNFILMLNFKMKV